MHPEEIKNKYPEALKLFAQGNFTAAIDILAEYADDSLDDKEMLANIRYVMGMCHWRIGRFDEAVSHFQKAQSLMKELRLRLKLPSVCNSLGLIYRKSGQFRDALVQFIEGLFYAFQLDDKNSMIAISCNIALCMQEMGDWERSIRGYDAALQLCNKLSDSQETNDFKCKILLNKCLILYSFGQVRKEDVLDYLAQVQDILDHNDLGLNLPEIETFMAHSYVQIEEYEKAFQILKGKDISDPNVISVSKVINLINLGIIHKQLHHDEVSFLKFQAHALNMAEEYKMLHAVMSVHQVLLKHYQSVGDKALTEFHEKKLKALKENNIKGEEIGYLDSILEAHLDAVESKSHTEDKIDDLLPEHDFLINNYTYHYRGINYSIPLRDIVYGEIKGDYLSLHTISDPDLDHFELAQTHKIRKPLKDFIGEINTAAEYFVKIHGSFIVNLYWVSKFPQKNLSRLTIGKKELTVSDTYRPVFREKLNGFLAAFSS